jgi:hypothetical protein
MSADWLLRKQFTLHSGAPADFKIECDALTDEEIRTFAWIIARRFKFCGVTGVPRGGLRIAAALEKYCVSIGVWSDWLIVDDVLTTGASMEKARPLPHPLRKTIGVVLFARGPCPEWVHPVFQLWDERS